MTHSENFTDPVDIPENMADFTRHALRSDRSLNLPGVDKSNPWTSWQRTCDVASADIEMATNYEERAQRLSSRLEGIEESIQLARMFMSASQAIEEILIDSSRLLERGRTLTEPSSRKALAGTYRGIKEQIDEIVADAEFDGQNLAAGDSLKVALDEDNSHIFQIDSSALLTTALGFSNRDCSFESDAEIVSEIMEIHNAVSVVGTRRTIVEMGLSVLENRANFTREKIDSLRSATHSLIGHDKAYGAICKIAAHRVEHAQPMTRMREPSKTVPVSRNTHSSAGLAAEGAKITRLHERSVSKPARSVTTDAKVTPIKLAADCLEEPEGSDELDCLARDMALLLKDKSYLSNWFKYESGDTPIFTRYFAESYGPELIQIFSKKYRDDEEFTDIADRYMAEFETRIEEDTKDRTDRRAIIEECLKTDQGTIYVILTRVSKSI